MEKEEILKKLGLREPTKEEELSEDKLNSLITIEVIDEKELLKKKCDELSEKLKNLNECVATLTKQNEEMRSLIANIYEKIGYSDSEDESDESEEELNVLDLSQSVVEELEKKQD